MESSHLPSVIESTHLSSVNYNSTSRLDLKTQLNTIIENDRNGLENDLSNGNDSSRLEDERGYRERVGSFVARSMSGSSSPTSTISSYYQNVRRSRDFDDLYDVSDDEWEHGTPAFRNHYSSLAIPSPREWPTIQNFQKDSQQVPPTPPPKIPISPAILSKLTPPAPVSSAPPSLDGSLTSDQLANSTAPPTPDAPCHPVNFSNWGQDEVVSECDLEERLNTRHTPVIVIEPGDTLVWDPDMNRPESPLLGISVEDNGVQLPADAMDTLQHLSFEEPEVVDSYTEMQEVQVKPLPSLGPELVPPSATSSCAFTPLSIPSPGGFFSSLKAHARHTWSFPKPEPFSPVPPSSSTAEHFYNAPWNQKVIESDDGSTAKEASVGNSRHKTLMSGSTRVDFVALGKDFDDAYEKDLRQTGSLALDRTGSWLASQGLYMSPLPSPSFSDTFSVQSTIDTGQTSITSPGKKVVKFLEIDVSVAKLNNQPPAKADPIFYEAFQHMSNASSPTDSFVHKQTRFDAMQAMRSSLLLDHVNQLLGNYQIIATDRPEPKRPISMFPGKRDEEDTAERKEYARAERERQAMEQLEPSMWINEALRYLNGGRLLNSPAVYTLLHAPPIELCNAAEQVKVLDLGGQPQCDWAWHCALEYPNVKTYTATCDKRTACNTLRGPSNQRVVRVDKLWELPFPDNYFDTISARSLYAFLKNERPLGETIDEYDVCLRECLRILKPGGYLEWFVLDSEIIQSGPRGSAASVEFGFNLKSRGYDPAPTKSWLARIRRAGLVDIKRAWMFLPMGTLTQAPLVPPETPPPNMSVYEENILTAEAVQGPVGSKADAAQVSGLVGSWAWEQWMLKLQMEMRKGNNNLLDGISAVIEEGRATGAGWRCLSGWARKP